MNDIEKEKIIEDFDFFNIKTEAQLQEEIADMIYLVISCDEKIISLLTNKIWFADEFYAKIMPSLKEDLEEGMFFENLVKCAKKIYDVEKIESVFDACLKYINRAFDEAELVIVKDFSDVFEMLEIKDFKIAFPEKWFSPSIYKVVTEFLKTFDCERCKIGKQTAFKNQGEFSNEHILQIGKELNGVSLSTKFDFCPTPAELVQKVQAWADIKENDLILEPSAGVGDLVQGLNKKNIVCVELNPVLASILKEKKFNTKNIAFEEFEPEQKFDKVIMNPPFSKRLDAKHIKRAFEMLKDGGELVAIHSAGILYATDKASKDFRALCDKYKTMQEKISTGAFADSAKGTSIETVITKLVKAV